MHSFPSFDAARILESVSSLYRFNRFILFLVPRAIFHNINKLSDGVTLQEVSNVDRQSD